MMPNRGMLLSLPGVLAGNLTQRCPKRGFARIVKNALIGFCLRLLR
jgi:hypothetical protein